MPKLLNYTTKVEVSKSIGQIMDTLSRAGARKITTEYDDRNNVVALSFHIQTTSGEIQFKLPANPEPVLAVLNKQSNDFARPSRRTRKKAMGNIDQARRVAWRIVKCWVEAQLAMIQTHMVSMDQVFLAYAVHRESGETFYEYLKTQRFSELAAGPGQL